MKTYMSSKEVLDIIKDSGSLTVEQVIELIEGGRSTKKIFGDFSSLYEYTGYAGLTGTAVDTSNANDIYSQYDSLITEHPNIVSKNLLGYASDSSGNQNLTLPIYEYVFQNYQKGNKTFEDISLKVLILTGIHGNEKSPVFGTMEFFKNILNAWRSSSGLESLKSNVLFKVIPIANPHGFNATTRYNARNVDLNRNFSYNWDTQVNQYKGVSALSELETVIIRNWLLDNDDANLFVDYHNTGESFGVSYLATQNQEIRNVYTSVIRRLSNVWLDEYGIGADNLVKAWTEGSLISGAVTESSESIGINYSAILEVAWDYNGEKYTREVMEITIGLLVNYLLAIINYLNTR